MRCVADGDQAAFKTLFEAYQQPLFRYLVRMVRDREMARDLTNEVMIEIWRGAGRFEGRSKVSTWIFGIAHNKSIDHLRKKRPDLLDEEALAAVPDTAPTPHDAAEQRSLQQVMRKVLDRLSPDHREIIQLTYYHGLSIKEAAEVADCPEGTVKTRMFHARRQLTQLLKEHGVEGVAS